MLIETKGMELSMAGIGEDNDEDLVTAGLLGPSAASKVVQTSPASLQRGKKWFTPQ